MDDAGSRGPPVGMEERLDDAEERFFAGPSESKAAEGDADLGDGKQPCRIGEQAEGRLRAGLAFFGKLPQARAAYGEQGHFRGGEEAVQTDEQRHQNEAKSQVRLGHGRGRGQNFILGWCGRDFHN